MTRLFFALDISDEDKNKISLWREQHFALPFKAIPRKNYHITLAFLGQLTESQQQALTSLVSHKLLTLKLDRKYILQLDYCRLFTKAKVLSIANSISPVWLQDLADTLHREALRLNIYQEIRPYCAHISLYRKAIALAPNITFSPLAIEIKSLSLYQSISSSDGVSYQKIKTWPLNFYS